MSRNEHFNAGAGAARVHLEHEDRSSSGNVDAYDKPGGTNIGSLSYWHLHERPGHIGVDQLDVVPEAQRKGVATAMYDRLLNDKPGHVIVHDVPNMSPEGRELAKKLKVRHPGRHKFERL